MIINKMMKKKMYHKLVTLKKISKVSVTEAEFCAWIDTIQAINALREEEELFCDLPLTKWKIDKRFSDLILPEKISVLGIRSDIDLLSPVYRDFTFDKKVILDHISFAEVSDGIAGTLRANADTVGINTLRAAKKLNDVYKLETRDGFVDCDNDGCRPIEFTGCYTKDRYLKVEAEDALLDWWYSKLKIVRG